MVQAVRRIATYERVSSEDQRERATIKTQTEELARQLQSDPSVGFARRYDDDGVSGTIPFAERPGGRRLMADAVRGLFDEVWVYRIDRLGRDDVDPLIVWRDLERLGITVHSVTEGVSSLFEYHIRVAMAAEERRAFLARSAAGMERAVREGRFPGGIVPFGYAVAGDRHNARLVIDQRDIWGGRTAGQVVIQIFDRSYEGWSDARIARELDELGVPTAYALAGRGFRKQATRNVWRSGRVGQILTSTTYYGEYRYGKRSPQPGRPIISVTVPALISKELWTEVREIRKSRRRKPLGECRTYLLRSVIRCGICGLNYTGSVNNGDVWYRCNGQLVARGPLAGRCPAKGVKGEHLEPMVKTDIERWLRSPGDLIDELTSQIEQEGDSSGAVIEAEGTALTKALDDLTGQRDRLLDLYLGGRFERAELDARMDNIEQRRTAVQHRLDELESHHSFEEPAPDVDLLAELHTRLDGGLSDDQWHELVTLLVRQIRIDTTRLDDRKKAAKAVVEYRFNCVVPPVTGRGSWPR